MAISIDAESTVLILRFDNRKPVRASDLANALRELARDYKEIYGGELGVSISEGSLIAKLRALSKIADGANHLYDFGKNISTILGIVAAAAGYAALEGHFSIHADSPLKAAEGLAKLAAESQSELEIKYERHGHETLFVKLTPSQARVAKSNLSKTIKTARLSAKKPTATQRTDIIPTGHTLKHRLMSIGSQAGGFKAISQETFDVIKMLVLELNHAAPNRVKELIRELEFGGHADAAEMIQTIIAAGSH